MSKISINGYEPRHLSYSTISGYRHCGKSWELSRVLRVEEKPGLASLAGNVVHTCTEVYDLAQCLDISAQEARQMAREPEPTPQVDILRTEVSS